MFNLLSPLLSRNQRLKMRRHTLSVRFQPSEETERIHRLTHRLLMITPFQTQQRPSEHLSDGLWVSLEHLADYGLPKPLIKYLTKG